MWGKMVEASIVDYPQMDERELSVWKTQPPPCSSPPLLLTPPRGPRPEAPPRTHAQAPAHGPLHQRPMGENGDTPPARPYSVQPCSRSFCLLLSQPLVLECLKAHSCCLFQKDLAICIKGGGGGCRRVPVRIGS